MPGRAPIGRNVARKKKQEAVTITEAKEEAGQLDLSIATPQALSIIMQLQSEKRRKFPRRYGGTLLSGSLGLLDEPRTTGRKRLLGE